jgi:hypothetical protein
LGGFHNGAFCNLHLRNRGKQWHCRALSQWIQLFPVLCLCIVWSNLYWNWLLLVISFLENWISPNIIQFSSTGGIKGAQPTRVLFQSCWAHKILYTLVQMLLLFSQTLYGTTLFFAFSVVLHLMLLLLIYLQHYIPTTRQIVFRDLVR